MARPHKEGIDYFSFDTDFFENKKVRKIMRGCGPGSATILICLLCNIYRDKGYYILWDEDSPFDIADKIGVSEGTVTEVVNKAIQVSFFSKHQFEKNKILTSREIQNRYLSATTKRIEVSILEKFKVSSGNNLDTDTRNGEDSNGNEQSKGKVKEIKEKESKGGASAPDPKELDLKKKQDDFYKSLTPFLQEFGKKILREFFDYWSEPNKSRTKLRWEMEKTWDLKKRLDRWRSNDDKFAKNEKKEGAAPPKTPAVVKTIDTDISFCLGRFIEGQLDKSLIKPEYYDRLVVRDHIPSGKLHTLPGESIEEQKVNGVIEYFNQQKLKHVG